MNVAEAAEALAMCAAYDNRNAGRMAAEAWSAALFDVSLADAKDAIIEHYSTNREWIMPADVRARVREIRRARLNVGTAVDGVIDADPDDPVAYIEALRARRMRVAAGEVERPVAALIEQTAAAMPKVPIRVDRAPLRGDHPAPDIEIDRKSAAAGERGE